MGASTSALMIAEEDGSPIGQPAELKVTNGTLTDNGDGSFSLLTGSGVAGSGTDNHIVRWDGTSAIQDSTVVIADTTGDVSVIGNITGKSGGITITGGTAAADTLTLVSTSNASKGSIFIGSAGTQQWELQTTGNLANNAATGAGTGRYSSRVSGDANDRFSWDAGGNLYWGDGTAVVDLIVGRSAANILQLSSGDSLSIATDGSSAGLFFGASSDVQIYRGAANQLTFPANDYVNFVGGAADPASTPVGSHLYNTTLQNHKIITAVGSGGVASNQLVMTVNKTVSGTTNETKLTDTFTLPDDSAGVAQKFHITAWGIITTALLNPGTLTLRLRYGGTGGTLLCATAANTLLTSLANQTWRIEADVTIVTTGDSGTCWANGLYTETSTAILGRVEEMAQTTRTAAVTIDTHGQTADLTLTAQFSSSTTNTMVCTQCSIIVT